VLGRSSFFTAFITVAVACVIVNVIGGHSQLLAVVARVVTAVVIDMLDNSCVAALVAVFIAGILRRGLGIFSVVVVMRSNSLISAKVAFVIASVGEDVRNVISYKSAVVTVLIAHIGIFVSIGKSYVSANRAVC